MGGGDLSSTRLPPIPKMAAAPPWCRPKNPLLASTVVVKTAYAKSDRHKKWRASRCVLGLHLPRFCFMGSARVIESTKHRLLGFFARGLSSIDQERERERESKPDDRARRLCREKLLSFFDAMGPNTWNRRESVTDAMVGRTCSVHKFLNETPGIVYSFFSIF